MSDTTLYEGATLQELKDTTALEAFSMTKADAHKRGICIDCKGPPNLTLVIDQDEYRISGLCNVCFEKITKMSEALDDLKGREQDA